MNDPTLACRDEQRRDSVRGDERFNGLDYLEVGDDQRKLTVFFLGKAPAEIEKENLRIEGGRRIRDIRVVDREVYREEEPYLDDRMEVVVDRAGDFSAYTLRVVELDERGRPTGDPMQGFDPRYSRLEFSFKAGCSSDLDCGSEEVCPPPEYDEPEINYLAKDYASFRQMILDRLSVVMPEWKERHVPDLGIALVEVLAYAGDHLSYFQDAVATEAYLETARRRTSVRRHARLVDYRLHEGCNARAWVCMKTDTDLDLEPDDIAFVAGYEGDAPDGKALVLDDLQDVPRGRYEIFEPIGRERIQLRQSHGEIPFYTWGDRECCLPRGSKAATLRDEWVETKDRPKGDKRRKQRRLHLEIGDVLIFEEVLGPRTGNPADRDPGHRHPVRLTSVKQDEDKLLGQPVVEIEWSTEDALPFPLCVSAVGMDCGPIEDVSVARGNVVLVDHGQTVENEDLGTVPEGETVLHCEDGCHPAETVVSPGKFRPYLQRVPLTFSEPLPANGPLSNLTAQDPRKAEPKVRLTATRGSSEKRWEARMDLLESHGRDRHFVVDVDDEGLARLRFGDGDLGRIPGAGTRFRAEYRVGNGPSGNVGAETISRLLFRRNPEYGASILPRNPIPARGGIAPETLAEARLFAPQVFRAELKRAITAEDYARLAESHPGVQRAAATLRWTGSWYEALVAIDPIGAVEGGPGGLEHSTGTLSRLLDEIGEYLYPYRRIGHDLAVTLAQYVSLDVALEVCVKPGFLRGHVKAVLLDLFSDRALSDGRRGFFHPDNLSFGDGIYLSNLVAEAQAVEGVEGVVVRKLERFGEGPNREIENGILPLGPLEVARLDNDPSFTENGVLTLVMKGGR